MNRLAMPWQAAFGAALLDPARAVPSGLVTCNGSDPAARFAVHRNNVVVSLVQALADGFPVVQRLVGEAFFAAMAGVYVRAHPPRSPVLAAYGDGFAEWIAAFEPAAGLPYLPDMARLERARVRAYHAADATPIGADAWAACLRAPERLGGVRLQLDPSVSAIASPWAVASLWAAHQHDDPRDDDAAIAAVALDQAEAALVLREGDDVLVLPVDRATAAFVQALQSALPLAAAVEAAAIAATAAHASTTPPFDLAGTLALLIRHGAITAWHHAGEAP